MTSGRVSLSFVCVFVVMLSMVDVARAGQCLVNTGQPVYGVPINVSLMLQAPCIKNEPYRTQIPQTWLVNFLNAAVDANSTFKNYTATYFRKLGYFINTINNVPKTPGKSYWRIIDARTGLPLQCGVSSFVPDNHDDILFKLTPYQ